MNIKRGIYQGYIWMSDSSTPTIVDGDFQLIKEDCENPFVIEGFLYNANDKYSIGIKFVDGHHIIKEWQLSEDDFKSDSVDVKTYLGNRMNGKWLKFLQFWDEKRDELCEGMNVEIPSKMVFIGFNDGE